MIDGRNHHLFQPLLYQVATASLATSEIALPIRSLLRKHKNATTLLGNVIGVNCEKKEVLLQDGETIFFDTLVWQRELGMPTSAVMNGSLMRPV